MAASSSLDNSRFLPESLSPEVDRSKRAPGEPPDVEAVVTDLRAKLKDVGFARNTFLNYAAEQSCRLTRADSTVVALKQEGTVVCVAKSGLLGPVIGAPMDSRSGISGECLRQGAALVCADTDKDPRVDAEVCRRLQIRSVVVVPVFDRSEVIGLVEAFSSRAGGFEDAHLAILAKLASLIADSRSQSESETRPPLRQPAVTPSKSDLQSMVVPITASRKAQPSKWIEAFRLRPYQIAIVIAFLLLDLGILYWWHQR